MKATQDIKDVFKTYDTNVLNISDMDIDDGYVQITHIVLDGNELLLYNANPDLGSDFQDDDYEQVLVEDCDDEKWNEIKDAIMSL
jgi:hypothetical protein